MGIDVKISLEKFACLLHLSSEGVDVHNVDLHDFAYPDGETALTASQLLHGDENPALVRKEEVKYYTLTAQVLAKIVFITSYENKESIAMPRGPLLFCSIAF